MHAFDRETENVQKGLGSTARCITYSCTMKTTTHT